MGNTSKKLAAKCTLLTKEEQKYVAATFRAASKNSERIREDDLIVSGKVDAVLLEKFWGPQIDPRLTQYLTNFLFGSGQQKTATVDFNRFAELYVYNVRGTVDERMMVTYNCLGMDYNEEVELPYQLLKEYCESIASTYIKMVKTSSSKRVRVWMEKGFRASASHVQALGEAVTATIGDLESPQHHCTAAQLSKWLQSNILLKQLAELVYVNLYGINKRGGDESPTPMPPAAPSLLPIPDGLDAMPDYPAFIDISHIVWINSHLPQKYQHKWRFLFSSHIHGESFSTMAGRIIEQGPSVLIIEDSSGHIFGGFAASAWAFGPNFTGTDDSFLFTAAPKMRVYPATNYNDHYQYINHHTKTLPNGLLMGGQFHFGGIWVNADPFGEGSSAESCSTYRGYRRLSKDPTFHIRSLEVWGVGDKPLTEKEQALLSERSARWSEYEFVQLIAKPELSQGFVK
ncbi:PREDICTED: TLD domain-containing protein 1 isoform X2 [Papilio polytes]|uniref:TLD domain-containing protein 1 isoform X2 n=1 Tax=Papilio polytes TaxID=76194 RepID=UPI000675E77E|nr:PREDICTED: TLD domain-containing protein 1 isoform X2 [Papilio polytes]